MIRFNIKETIKTFILAPAVAGITYMVTNIMVQVASGSGIAVLDAGYYPIAVAGLSFALILIYGLDEIIDDIKTENKV